MLLDRMFALSIARGKVLCYNKVVNLHTFNDFRRREMMKKTLSVCLALLMLLSCFAMPTTAFAAAPKKPTVSSVSAGVAAFTVKWKKVSGVTGYQVQYSTSSKFTSKTSKTATAKKDKTTAKTVSGLKSKTKYYVRVRTYKTSGKKKKYSSWSSAKSVTTKVAKVNFKSVSAERLGFTVKWSKAPSVSGYRVQYSTSSKFDKKVTKALKVTNGNATSATITGLKGSKNSFFDSYFESLLTDMTLPTGLPPSTSVNKSADTDLNGKSLITSRLRDTDVASLSIKDNNNGTITLTIKPKAVQMSSPGADAQGRFFTTAGPMYDAIDQVIKENGGKWTTGNAKKNVTMNYTGGTGTITINTSTGKISKAKYKMIVKAEIRNITLSGQKFKSIAMDCSMADTFPATGSNFADWGIALV